MERPHKAQSSIEKKSESKGGLEKNIQEKKKTKNEKKTFFIKQSWWG